MKFNTIQRKGEGKKYSGPKKDEFLKVKSGQSIQGIFVGEPYQFYQHSFYPEKKFPELCVNPETCKHCSQGMKPAFRFRVNIIIKENGRLVAKVFESGWKVWQNLMVLNQKFDISRNTIDMTRNGSGTETTYTIIPLPDGKLNDEMFAKISAIPLVELEHKPILAPDAEEAPEHLDELPPIGDEPVFPDVDNDSDLPF